MLPAKAVTSPSFATASGISPISLAALSYIVFTSSRRSRGTFMNMEEIIGELPTNTPAEDTPMPSTRGSLEAAVFSAFTISLY